MYDAIIIGAGPAGTCCARKLAEEGYSVVVYEKRNEIGAPKRCGEGLEKKAEKLIGKIPGKCIAQRIKGARIYAPNGKYLEVVMEGGGFVLERKSFDKWLAVRAVDAGAYVQAGTNINELIIEDGYVRGVKGKFIDNEFEERASIVIFAGGSDSSLPKQANLNTTCNPKLIDTCLQYEMANVKSNPNFIHIYMGNKIAPRGYCWIFPKGNRTANVGVGVVPSVESPKYYLDKFVRENEDLSKASIIEVNAGGVPVGGLLKDMVTNGMIVCGEAAHHVNPIHGGGIKEAIISGQIAADVAATALKKKDCSKKALSEFNSKWWELRGNHLSNVEKVREVMENLNDSDFNMLAESFRPRDIIEFTRGAKLKIFARALMKNPKLVTLVRHLI
ncbi:MAG: NAD(P)/FAD-dependent oxidoreductase [Candidatus Micrarchaeia archaeon]